MNRILIACMPGMFVVLWATGFIGGKFGLPYAEPFTFITYRLVMVIAVFILIALATRAPWPKDWRLIGHIMMSGLLVHGIYLGGVFKALHLGIPAGMVSLIAGLQPVLTAAVVGKLLGERVSMRQWAGFALGLVGVGLVLSSKLGALVGGAGEVLSTQGLLITVGALFGITASTLYQKRFCGGMDLRTGAVWQYVGALVLLWPLALFTETMEIQWTGEFIFAMTWLIFVLSVGAITLLSAMIQMGEASRVASLFYLVPPVTALMAWALFGETLNMYGVIGMAVAAIGVAMVVKRTAKA